MTYWGLSRDRNRPRASLAHLSFFIVWLPHESPRWTFIGPDSPHVWDPPHPAIGHRGSANEKGGTIAQPMGRDNRSADLVLAAVLFILYLSINVPTLHRYGITADEPEHWFFGDRYLEFYLSCYPKAIDFSSAIWPPVQT